MVSPPWRKTPDVHRHKSITFQHGTGYCVVGYAAAEAGVLGNGNTDGMIVHSSDEELKLSAGHVSFIPSLMISLEYESKHGMGGRDESCYLDLVESE